MNAQWDIYNLTQNKHSAPKSKLDGLWSGTFLQLKLNLKEEDLRRLKCPSDQVLKPTVADLKLAKQVQ